MTETNFYEDKNEIAQLRSVIVSPSNKYKLLIRSYTTGKGTWSVTRGTIYRVSDNKEICDIKRNYSGFHHSFVTKNGQEYIITGRSYMGQTIVNLDTGEEWNSKDGKFCWISAELSPDGNTLLVYGCYWACPSDYKVFDFTDPSKGWEELPIKSNSEKDKYYIESDAYTDAKWINENTVESYKADKFYKPLQKRVDDVSYDEIKEQGASYKDEANWDIIIDATFQHQRQGNSMVLIKEELSEYEIEYRKIHL